MRVTVVVQNEREDFLTLDVGPETTVALLKTSIAIDADIPDNRQRLFFNEQPLRDDAQTLAAAGIGDGDMIRVREVRAGGPGPSQAPAPGAAEAPPQQPEPGSAAAGAEAEAVRQGALRDPVVEASLRHHRPELAEALRDPERFRRTWDEMRAEARAAREAEARRLEGLASEDAAHDPDKQREIEEEIRMEAVEANRQHAIEYLPEAFGRVYMLYIPVEVNGHAIKAFVDSGAQTTIMSPACAARCEIMRLLDPRYAGIARGVGTARILGRVHAAQIRIGASFLGFSATVMEGKGVDLLLGLDMLKGFRACIDLGKGVLRIGDDEVPFLGEADIPKPEEEWEDEGEAAGGAAGTAGAVVGPTDPSGGTASAASAAARATDPPASTATPPPAGTAAPEAGPASAVSAPASRAPAAGSGSQPAAPGSGSAVSRAGVEQLLAMGFAEGEAMQALRLAGGNVDLAASMLFGG